MSALIQLRNVTVRFGRVAALEDVDLRIAPGERVALIGANGSGKSTLLRVLNGLVPPSAGSLLRDGAAAQAMVFQRPFMLRASALFNVALALWVRGARWPAAKEAAWEALRRVGLEKEARRNARHLSSGQQQRLALGRAWATKPDVLLLDEPTASLDPHGKREVERVMADIAAAGTTLVFSSHNLGQVKRLATRVVYLEHGFVLADEPVGFFFDGPLEEVSHEAALFVKGELG